LEEETGSYSSKSVTAKEDKRASGPTERESGGKELGAMVEPCVESPEVAANLFQHLSDGWAALEKKWAENPQRKYNKFNSEKRTTQISQKEKILKDTNQACTHGYPDIRSFWVTSKQKDRVSHTVEGGDGITEEHSVLSVESDNVGKGLTILQEIQMLQNKEPTPPTKVVPQIESPTAVATQLFEQSNLLPPERDSPAIFAAITSL
jgi:hypothetical protein